MNSVSKTVIIPPTVRECDYPRFIQRATGWKADTVSVHFNGTDKEGKVLVTVTRILYNER